jgi:hypothetical protein
MPTEFITDVIDIPDLVGYVRERAVLEPPTLLGGVVPELEVEDLEYELTNSDATFVNVARYRSWDTAPPLGKRPGVATVRGEIAPLGLSLTLNEKELKRFSALQQGLPTGTADDIYDDALHCGLACRARFETAIGDLLHDGIVTINENGATVTANFAVPSTHLVTAAIAWSTVATAVPITNLLAWEAIYRADNGGRNPDAWLISSEAFGNLAFNAQIKSLAAGTSGVTPGIVSAEQIGQAFSAAGVRAPFVVFDGMVPNASGVATPTLPVRDVIAVRAGMASLLYGTTPSAELLVGNGVLERTDAAGIVAYSEQQIRPARVITTGEAVGLPVLRDPNALFRAIV